MICFVFVYHTLSRIERRGRGQIFRGLSQSGNFAKLSEFLATPRFEHPPKIPSSDLRQPTTPWLIEGFAVTTTDLLRPYNELLTNSPQYCRGQSGEPRFRDDSKPASLNTRR